MAEFCESYCTTWFVLLDNMDNSCIIIVFQINELMHVTIPVMLLPDDFRAYSKLKVDNHLFNKYVYDIMNVIFYISGFMISGVERNQLLYNLPYLYCSSLL